MKKHSILITLLTLVLVCNPVKVKAEDTKPKITAETAITVDVGTKEMIYTKDIDKHMYPASMTKLITSMLLSENKKPEDTLTYTIGAKRQEPFSINFNLHDIPVGTKISSSDAMKAMLLSSANDMAYMISNNIGNSEADFINKMNNKAKEFNLKNTHFVTPNGLHNPDHYSSAYDFSVIGRHVYDYPWILNTIKEDKDTFNLKLGRNEAQVKLENTNKLLGKDGCIGGKTGYTDAAGRCLIAFYERDGRKIIGVVMHSRKDLKDTLVFDDMKKIIDWSYDQQKVSLMKAGTTVKTVKLKYKVLPFVGPTKSIDVPLLLKDDIKKYSNDEEYKITTTENSLSPWKMTKNTAAGSVTLQLRDSSAKSTLYPAVTTEDIINSNKIIYIIVLLAAILVLGLIIIASIKLLGGRKNKTKNKYF